MTPASWPPDTGLAAFDEIDSTNEEARRRAAASASMPLWIVAKRQTAGRGRHGRSWASLEGNLLTTLLMAPGRSAADSARLSFVAALAVRDMIATACPKESATLKWPNDVLLDRRKCAGILLETGGEKDGVLPWIAIGVGVNLAHKPDLASYPAAALSEFSSAVAPQMAMERLAWSWSRWFAVWRDEGFAPIREAWLTHAANLGGPIVVRLHEVEDHGRFQGLDADGNLILARTDGSLRAISSGEVFFGD